MRHTSIIDVHVILRRDGRILLGRRADTGFGDGMLHLPSGHLEAGESITTAAIREAAEEIAVVIDPADLRCAHVMHRAPDSGPDRVGFFFIVDRWTGEPVNSEPDRCSELVWVDPAALPSDVIAYPAAAIRAALAQSAYSEFGWAGPA